jgi:hypothetical protein
VAPDTAKAETPSACAPDRTKTVSTGPAAEAAVGAQPADGETSDEPAEQLAQETVPP